MKNLLIAAVVIVAIVITGIFISMSSGGEKQNLEYTIILQKTNYINEPIQPIPENNNLIDEKVALGESLFHDTKLSHDNSISCASCHEIKKMGTDQKVFSVGINGKVGDVNAPTVMNSGFNFKQFWDGRASTLEEQVDGPTHNPIEMGSNWDEIVEKLKKDPGYMEIFEGLYSDGIQPENIRDAIAEYERSLITPNSRFDQFLLGEKNAITVEELEGYQLFKNFGCVSCHQGINVGGNMFQKFGIFGNLFEDRNQEIRKADLGRFNVTQQEQDKFKFKVPSLRNVEFTAPYFHDGSVKTLEEAVQIMIKYQLGRKAQEEEIKRIVKFLKTLTGKYKKYKS